MDNKILIIEDDEAIAQIYRIALTHRNHEAEIAIDGIEGVAKAKEILPKLILLDIMMPRKNGVEVIEELKADPNTQNIPVFVLSNLVDLEMVDKMKQNGALKYLVKSQYTPDQIVDIVEEYFNNPTKNNDSILPGENQSQEAQPQSNSQPVTPKNTTPPQENPTN